MPRGIRNSLRSPSRSAQWLWDSVQFYAGARKVLALTPALSMVCHPRAYRPALEAQVKDPSQREEFLHFLSLCKDGMFLFDIGAHFGIFSIAAALQGGRAVAVDPSPAATRMITTQANLNGCTEKIRIIRSAVSDSNGTIAMLSAGVFSQGYFQFVKGRSKRELTKVPAVTIDELMGHFGVPTHVKIDVEGHEAAVLRGARRTLSDHRPMLLLELHNEMVRLEGGDPRELLDEIAKLGFRTFTQTGCAIRKEHILREPIIRIVAMSDNHAARDMVLKR